MGDLTLKAVVDGTALKLEWFGDDIYVPSYGVDAAAVQEAADNIRNSMKVFACNYMTTRADYSDDLSALRVAGSDLRAILFDRIISGNDDSAAVVDNYLTTQSNSQIPLRIITDAAIQVPWNFIFDGDAMIDRRHAGDMSDFNGFWLNKFKIYVRFNSLQVPAEDPLDGKTLKTLFALDENEFVAAREQLLVDKPHLEPAIGALISHEVGPVLNWSDCRNKWQAIGDSDSIIYIFGHSNGKEISLKGEPSTVPLNERTKYVLGIGNFSGIFMKKRDNKSKTICLINGCRSAGGELSKNFLGVTSAKGFHGFVGAEAEIPNVDATLYATQFLDRLLNKGQSVGSIIQDLREELFPFGVWYACYAEPNFRIGNSNTQSISNTQPIGVS